MGKKSSKAAANVAGVNPAELLGVADAPPTLLVGGVGVLLGEIVQACFDESGLDAAAWNALSDDERGEQIHKKWIAMREAAGDPPLSSDEQSETNQAETTDSTTTAPVVAATTPDVATIVAAAADTPMAVAGLASALVAIGYCGLKSSEVDTVAGTGLTWTPGDIHHVTRDQAARLLRHEDVWFDASPEGSAPITPKESTLLSRSMQTPEEEALMGNLPPNVRINDLDDNSLRQLAVRHYGLQLPPDMQRPDMLAKLNRLAQGLRFDN